MKKSDNISNAAGIIEAHFSKVQHSCKAPSLGYGVTFANKKIVAQNVSLPFRIASMSKSFTAAATLLLRDRNKLTLDQPVGDIVPELKSLKLPTKDSPQITVRHLLTMSAGLATDDPWGDRHLDADHAFMQKLFADGGYFAEPVGTEFVYSNYGYAILGRVISNVSGQSFQQFISSELLQPLAMASTSWSPAKEYAKPHRLRDGVAIDEGLPALADGGFASMGGIWSTADDLLIWTNFLMNAFPARDDHEDGPLSRASRREMQQVWRAMKREYTPGPPQRNMIGGYGMGLRLFDDTKLGYIVTHSGGLPGYGSNMMWFPERKVAIVALANITYAPMFDANFSACDALFAEGAMPPVQSKDSKPVEKHAYALFDLLSEWDDAKAHNIFADNVILDEPFDRRKKEFATIAGKGAPFALGEITAQNAACGEFIMIDRSGLSALKVSFKLSPQVPPRIQSYVFTKIVSAPPLAAR